MKAIRFTLSTALALGIFLMCGATCKQARLETGGAYAPAITNAQTGVVTPTRAPDLQFYQTDAAYAAAYAAIDGLFKFERDNRAALWKISPEIKLTLDKIRPDAWAANVSYHRAREAYKAIPVAANLTTLEQVLAKMNQLLAVATAVMPKGETK